MYTNKDNPIIVSPEAEAFEVDYCLPELVGSPRQIAWARLIRFDFLSKVLPSIVDVTKDVEAYKVVDGIRKEKDAKTWIEVIKPQKGKEMLYVMGLVKQRAETEDDVRALLQEP